MLSFEDSAISCGVAQAFELGKSTPIKQVLEIADRYFEECGDWNCDEYGRFCDGGLLCAHRSHSTNYAHFVFSDVVKSRTGNGTRLAAFLRKIDVGVVFESPIAVNPNSGNRIRVWVFTPHRMNLFNWVRKNQDSAKKESAKPKIAIGRAARRR